MKKKSWFLAVCIGVMLNAMPVQADLIWEPMGDSFYAEYADECEYENRTYIAKADKVVVYESPISDREVDVWEKGKTAYISFVYEDEKGNVWGIYDNGDASRSGWITMADMALKYDSQAFKEEYAQQIVEEEVMVNGDTEAMVGFWAYPGAKVKNDVNVGEEGLMLNQTFTDEAGHKWAYVGYFRAMKNYWVCVDAPMASYEELYPDGAPERGVLLEGTDAVVVEGTQYVAGVGQTEREDGDKTENGTSNGEKTAPFEEAGEQGNANQQNDSADAESQVPFVVGCVAGVVVVTGSLLALLKRSFYVKSKKNS